MNLNLLKLLLYNYIITEIQFYNFQFKMTNIHKIDIRQNIRLFSETLTFIII